MRIVVLILCCVFLASCGKPTQTPQTMQEPTLTPAVIDRAQADSAKQEEKQEWKKVGSFGVIITVYMSPAGLSDKNYIAQVLHTLRSQNSVQQIWFFDKKSYTPTGVPMTDKQMLHWCAKYSINRNTGHEEFVFIKITDPKTSPPEISTEKANIRPGYVE